MNDKACLNAERPPFKVRNRKFCSAVRSFWQRSVLPTQILISAFFVVLLGLFYWSSESFWENTQVPRLKKAAETQAQILAESQSSALAEILQREVAAAQASLLADTLKKMLIVEDPAIGERFIRHIALELDYTTLDAEPQSLDMQQGEPCDTCFQTEVLLTDREGNILGLASFAISGGYFDTLVEEMRPRLFAESGLILLMVVIVWSCILFMFYRLQAAKRLIEASDQAKTRFMANVTHELRTPLNAILGYTQLYKKDAELPRHLHQGVETIDRSAAHLLLMINDILEFSRSNQETLSLHPGEIDMGPFLTTLVEMVRVRARLNSLDFQYEFSPDLPAVILADEKRLRQVLLNILGNAVKFTPQGQITFTVKRKPGTSSTHLTLIFDVKDTGIGIDKEQLQAIFIPFQQVDNPINRAEGTGLGLAISQRLLSLMNSELKVHSEMNKGSRFWFYLNVPILDQQTMACPAKGLDTAKLILPDDAFLKKLLAQLRRQNILGVRELISELESDGRYVSFLREVKPFLQNYRFKQLVDWLEQYGSTPTR